MFTSSRIVDLLISNCQTSQAWHHLPETDGKYKTLHRNFMQLTRMGVFAELHRRVIRLYTRPFIQDPRAQTVLTSLENKCFISFGSRVDTESERDMLLQGPLACDSMHRRDLALKRKRSRVAWTRGWGKHLRQQGVNLIAFGNGQCNARGHRKMPTKQVIQHLASVIGVLVIDEFGTSSRCPTCKSTTKLTRADAGDTMRFRL